MTDDILAAIDARLADLAVDEALALAAGQYEPEWEHVPSAPAWKDAPLVVGRTWTGADDDLPVRYVIVQGHGSNRVATTEHIAHHDPATVLERVRRERAACDADQLLPDCLRLTPRLVEQVAWLPGTCAYKLRARGAPLPDWHYLISGDRSAVVRAGVSISGRVVSETEAGPLEQHITVWEYPE